MSAYDLRARVTLKEPMYLRPDYYKGTYQRSKSPIFTVSAMKLPEIARELNTLICNQVLELKKHSPNELVPVTKKFDARKLRSLNHKEPTEKLNFSLAEIKKKMRIQDLKAQNVDRNIDLMNGGEVFLKVKSFHRSFGVSNARRCLRSKLPAFALPKEPLSQTLVILPSKLKY